jgi:hypothetical protein
MTIATFWNEQHPLSKKAQALYDKLVPDHGSCDTLQGELIRSSNKITYDWFNNGWGCNNWSGAVRFIQANFTKLPNLPDAMFVEQLMKELEYVSQYSHGEPCSMKYDGKVCMTVTKIHEIVVNALLANPTPIENKDDWLKYQEDRYEAPYEEEEEYDDEEY